MGRASWASTLAGFAAWWLVTQRFFVQWAGSLSISNPLRLVVDSQGDQAIYEPWQITFYLGAGLSAGVVVSLLTPAVDALRLHRFYALTRTPVQANEQIEEPCSLPKGARPVARRMLVTACGLEVPRPSLTSLAGFAAGWACVCGLIVGFIMLVAW